MLRVVLVDDERCSLDELACGLGDHAQIVGNFSNLLEAVEKIKEIKTIKPTAMFLDLDSEMPQRISLWNKDKVVLVNISKIACCFVQKAQRKVTVVADNKIYESSDTLNDFLDKIGKNKLVRCHRSFAINPEYLLEMVPGKNNTMVARITGYNREIPVSRQYSHSLRSIVGLRIRADCKNSNAVKVF